VPALALDNAHAVAFHTGLGAPVYPSLSTPQKYLNEEYIASYADVVYSKPNIAVVADGASPDALSKWVGQFFKDVPASSQSGQSLKVEASKYHGGEQRTNHAGGNSMVIAFPGSDSNGSKPEIAVLAALLGGKPTIKWTPGFSLLSKATAGSTGLSVSSANLAYSDAGLLAIQLTGPAAAVRKAAEDTAKALKSVADGSVSKEDVAKAVANAKFDALEKAQFRGPSILQAGSGLVHSGKAADLAALASGIDSVTADKLKTVRCILKKLTLAPYAQRRPANFAYRPPRLSWTARPLCRRLATCSCCRTPRRLVCGYKGTPPWTRKACTNSCRGGLDGVIGVLMPVNICSRNPLCSHGVFLSSISGALAALCWPARGGFAVTAERSPDQQAGLAGGDVLRRTRLRSKYEYEWKCWTWLQCPHGRNAEQALLPRSFLSQPETDRAHAPCCHVGLALCL